MKSAVFSFVAMVYFFYFVLAVGWVANIYQIATSAAIDLANLEPVSVVKIIGVFIPSLGGVMGLIGFF